MPCFKMLMNRHNFKMLVFEVHAVRNVEDVIERWCTQHLLSLGPSMLKDLGQASVSRLR